MRSKTLCPLPWVHQATYTDGSVLPCCVAGNIPGENLNHKTFKESWNSSFMKNLRLSFLKGEKPKICSRCWEEEAAGYKSHRLTEIEAWNRILGADKVEELYLSTNTDGGLNFNPVSYDLRLGNACNLQCVMCRPRDSSKWFGLAKKIKENTSDWALQGDMEVKLKIDKSLFSWAETNDFWRDISENLGSVKELIFGGGEPFLWSKHTQLIEKCVSSGKSSDIQIRYHTNLTVFDKSLFSLWKHFKRVEIFASIDAVGEKNNYVRYPAKWDSIENNLRVLETESPDSIFTMILTSIHALSFYDLDKFSSWIQSQNFRKVTHGFNGYYHPGLVIEPKFLNVQIYPQAIKEKIKEKILRFESQSKKPSNKIQGAINYMFEKDQSYALPVLKNYIKVLDKTRGTNFCETFPELSQDLNLS